MFQKILIANRSEIAVRIIRACRELGIGTVAVYSEADRNALHVRLADEAYLIGPSPARESYLNIERIVETARQAGADAIHPGYGFLSENAAFGEAVEAAGITFIGPPPALQRLMGEKTSARRAMHAAEVPTVPGTLEALTDPDELAAVAEQTGFPIMLKAAGGGGGKGLRAVRRREELPAAIRTASAEALSAFNNSELYVEKLVERARHIEIQIAADQHGNVVHLGERECSIQRRHQKVIEECPSPVVSPEMRRQMGEAAVRGAKAVGYTSVGTMEFLVDPDMNFYFLEMNTRLQVEHPVTEWVTSVDLVKEQIRIAMGEPLSFRQEDVTWRGAAIECRIYAEDPFNNFLPSTGTIHALREPSGPGIRVDSAAYPKMEVGVYYDPIIAKLAVWAPTRAEAIARTQRALREYDVVGVKTTLPFHEFMLDHPAFEAARFDTGFAEREFQGHHPSDLTHESESLAPMAAVIAAVAAHLNRQGAFTRGPSDGAVAGEEDGQGWRRVARAYGLRRV